MSLRSRSKCEIKTCHEAYNHVTEKKYENTSNEKNSSKNSVKMVQFFQKLTSAIFKGIALYFIWKFVSSYILPMSKFGIRTQDNTRYINNVWSAGEKMDLYLYISSESIQTKFHQTELYLFQKDIEFGSYSKKSFLKTEKQICSSNFSQDYPLYGHIYLMRSGFHPDPKISKFNHLNCSYRRSVLTGKMKRPLKKSNLLEFSNQSFVNDHAAKDDVLYWYPEIRISIVQKTDPISENSLFSPLRKYISTTINESKYFPIVYLNEAWRISEKRLTVDSLHSIQYYPLQIIVEPISFIRFQTSVHFSESLKINQSLLGENEDIEQIKRLFSETNPYLLFVTIIVSILHTIFDFLAFKNGKYNNFMNILSV